MTQNKDHGLATRLIHAGEPDDPQGPVAMPVYDSAAFKMPSWQHHEAMLSAPSSGPYYSRGYNPTVRALEERISAIEGGGRALAFGAGMAAITTTLMTLCRDGGHVIVSDKVFATSHLFVTQYLPAFGASMTYVDFADIDAVDAAITPETKAIFFETFTNPLLHVLDLEALVRAAHEQGVLAVVDNSFASPALFRPLDHGADIVIHSATKHLSGHGRLLGGVAVSNDSGLMDEIAELRREMGTVITPHNASGILQGLATLQLRLERASQNAAQLVSLALNHEATTSVNYPGLPDSPGHDIATKLTGGLYGSVFSFGLSDLAKKEAVYDAFELITRSTSFGDVITSVDSVPTPDVLRISTGIEDITDLSADLQRALDVAV